MVPSFVGRPSRSFHERKALKDLAPVERRGFFYFGNYPTLGSCFFPKENVATTSSSRSNLAAARCSGWVTIRHFIVSYSTPSHLVSHPSASVLLFQLSLG